MEIGDQVAYYLLPLDNPTDRNKLWHGRVQQIHLTESGTVASIVVVSLEAGYEDLLETVFPEQIKPADC